MLTIGEYQTRVEATPYCFTAAEIPITVLVTGLWLPKERPAVDEARFLRAVLVQNETEHLSDVDEIVFFGVRTAEKFKQIQVDRLAHLLDCYFVVFVAFCAVRSCDCDLRLLQQIAIQQPTRSSHLHSHRRQVAAGRR